MDVKGFLIYRILAIGKYGSQRKSLNMHEVEMCIVSLLMFLMGAAPAGEAARETQNWDADGLSAWTVGSQH